MKKKYIVRLWDGFDHMWVDITGPISHKAAKKIWNEKTADGTKMTAFQDIDYYSIFPADTKMLYRPDGPFALSDR